jgi:Fe-S-cluster containining protein
MRFDGEPKLVNVLDTAAALRDEADRRLAGRLDASAKRGSPAACRPGCDACCRQLITISPLEAHAIAEDVHRSPQLQMRTEAALQKWRSDLAWRLDLNDAVEHFRQADGYVSGPEGGRLEADYWAAGIPCPFLDDGRCSIYEVRPFNCREHYVLSEPLLCRVSLDAPIPAGTRMEYRAVANEVGMHCFGMADRLLLLPDAVDYARSRPQERAAEAPAVSVINATEKAQRQARLALAMMGFGRLMPRAEESAA